jgi:hypothetical protein
MSRYQISIEKGVCVSGILSSIDRTGIKEVVLDKRVLVLLVLQQTRQNTMLKNIS